MYVGICIYIYQHCDCSDSCANQNASTSRSLRSDGKKVHVILLYIIRHTWHVHVYTKMQINYMYIRIHIMYIYIYTYIH